MDEKKIMTFSKGVFGGAVSEEKDIIELQDEAPPNCFQCSSCLQIVSTHTRHLLFSCGHFKCHECYMQGYQEEMKDHVLVNVAGMTKEERNAKNLDCPDECKPTHFYINEPDFSVNE